MSVTTANKAAMLNKYDVCLFVCFKDNFIFVYMFVCFYILHDNVLWECETAYNNCVHILVVTVRAALMPKQISPD